MSENSQFYADNEQSTEGQEKNVDLSLAYEVKPNAVPEDEWEEQEIAFFCHDCGKRVSAKKNPKKVKFSCQECGGGNISFGTAKSIEGFFHLNAEGVSKK
jgi:hypothetical protein